MSEFLFQQQSCIVHLLYSVRNPILPQNKKGFKLHLMKFCKCYNDFIVSQKVWKIIYVKCSAFCRLKWRYPIAVNVILYTSIEMLLFLQLLKEKESADMLVFNIKDLTKSTLLCKHFKGSTV